MSAQPLPPSTSLSTFCLMRRHFLQLNVLYHFFFLSECSANFMYAIRVYGYDYYQINEKYIPLPVSHSCRDPNLFFVPIFDFVAVEPFQIIGNNQQIIV